MYVSWNDFAVGNAALVVSYSSDGGATWAAPVVVSNTGTFVRDVQITGDLSGNGVVYIAGMNEGGGGFPHNNINKIFKSTNGGASWTNTYTGPAFPGPGVTAVGYFACMFPDGGGYWRHEGWGEPAAYNNVVHLVYAQQGTGSDAGDVYYIRSADGGVTFSAPFKLNTDATTRPQWQPNISVSPSGTLLATWYDGRESASCTRGSTGVPCYRMWSRKSNDNGATWLPDDTFSDVVTPLPAQPDPGIRSEYAGDYDYGSATAAKHVTSWTDGRNPISGSSQQDAYTDREIAGPSPTASPTATATATASPTPTATATPTACTDQYGITQIGGSVVPGTTDIGNHTDDGTTFISLPFTYQLYDQTFTSMNLSSNGNAQFTTADNYWVNSCPLPWTTHNYTIYPYWGDQRTDLGLSGCAGFPGGNCGIFTSTSGTAPNRIFNIEFRTVYYNNNAQTANYELRLYEGQSRFDVIYGTVAQGNTSATAGVQKNDTTFDQYFCNSSGGAASGGQSYTLTPCGTPTPTPTASPSPTPTATATATPTPCTRPAAPSAQSATNVTFSSFTAHWSSVSGATGYLLDVATSNSFTTYVPGYQNLDVGNMTSFPVIGLSAHTTYYYRVRAYNGCATSPNSSVKNVQTLPCTPAAPSAQSATNVTFSSFTANWRSVSGATDYRLDVSTSNTFTSYVPGYQDRSVGNVTSFPVTGLVPQTTYYYRVRALNGCATSSNSSVKNVQTLPCTPAAPSAQSATNVTSSSFTANWRSVSGAIDYRLDVSTSNTFTTFVYQNLDAGTMTSYPVTGLNAHTTYYYRVRAYNGCATSSNSNVKSVQTSP